MTNPLKGEIQLNIGGTEYKARLTVDAIMSIETQVGCGILKLAQRMSEGDIRVSDIIAVLTPALRGGGKNVQAKDVGNIVAEAGIVECTTAIANLLTMAISPPRDDSEEDSDEGKPQEQGS
tara:strand:- start:174 stop:536 length:363 start_codon:yes stop_codon:yes gene_type:complete